MGQAKARGSKDQRVAEAVERARVAEIARNMRKEAERKAFAEAQEDVSEMVDAVKRRCEACAILPCSCK